MKCFLTVVACAFALATRADYMLWQIQQDAASESSIAFAYAKIVVKGEGVAAGTYLEMADIDTQETLGTSLYNPEFPESTYSLPQSYAFMGDYNSPGYGFAVELYGLTNGQGELLGMSEFVSFEMVSKFSVYSDMKKTGITPYTFNAFRAAPEPTSGLLMLLGLGALALRRKRTVACAAVATLGLAAAAAPNDTLLSFATPGTDRCADGSRVLDGGCYALVWTANGATFGGLTDGAKTIAETDRLMLVAPIARNGRCPMTVLEIAADVMPTYDGGTFGLYLLDTRVRTEDGAVALAPFKDGAPVSVNALGSAIAKTAAASDARVGNALVAQSPVSLGTVGLYTEIAAPRITAIRIDGATVTLQVEGMSPVADYFVIPGVKPREAAPTLDAKPENGAFTFPKPEGAPFFKVIGARKF